MNCVLAKSLLLMFNKDYIYGRRSHGQISRGTQNLSIFFVIIESYLMWDVISILTLSMEMQNKRHGSHNIFKIS